MKNTSRNDILKIIAMVTMLVDHIGVLIFPELRILRTIGRIAFPIFAYQLALGFKHTGNRRRYRKNLFVFGLISQIPYMLLNSNLEPRYYVFNVILLFWFATFALGACEKAKESIKKEKNYLIGIIFSLITLILIFLPDVTQIIFSDFTLSYGTYGMLLMVMFYLANQNPIKIVIGFLVITLFSTLMSGMYVLYHYYDMSYNEIFNNLDIVWDNIVHYKDGLRTLEGYFFQARSIMAIPIIIGLEYLKPKFKINKKIGYYFYPIHINLLILLRLILEIGA